MLCWRLGARKGGFGEKEKGAFGSLKALVKRVRLLVI